MRGNVVETLIGAVVLVVAMTFLGFAYTRADVGTVRGYELLAKFDRVDGLKAGSDVVISGIKVGTVADLELDPDTYFAVARLSIGDTVKLPLDSSAQIGSDGLLGDKYVIVVPGGEEEYLQAGDEIKFTQGAIDLIGLVGQAIFSQGGSGKGDTGNVGGELK